MNAEDARIAARRAKERIDERYHEEAKKDEWLMWALRAVTEAAQRGDTWVELTLWWKTKHKARILDELAKILSWDLGFWAAANAPDFDLRICWM